METYLKGRSLDLYQNIVLREIIHFYCSMGGETFGPVKVESSQIPLSLCLHSSILYLTVGLCICSPQLLDEVPLVSLMTIILGFGLSTS